MRTQDMIRQRLLFLTLRLKHRYTLVEHIALESIQCEIDILRRMSYE